jgi:hypothetical protein
VRPGGSGSAVRASGASRRGRGGQAGGRAERNRQGRRR